MARLLTGALVAVFCVPCFVRAREWQDASKKYHVKADLLARNETMVVLEKENKDLIGIKIDQLSEEDREYLESLANESEGEHDSSMQTWTTRRGLQIRGTVVEYARRDIEIQRRRGKVYVNDKRFDNLPGVYRKMLPLIVTHFEKVDFAEEKDLLQWIKQQRGGTKTYTCDGVLLELENGDLYGVPFFFFSEQDLKVLEPGWQDWLKSAEDEELREQQSLSLQAQAMANQQHQAEMRQVAMLQLQLQGYQAGLFDLWEVAMFPRTGVSGMPVSVVVPARSSSQATEKAMAKYPNYAIGSVAKVSRGF